MGELISNGALIPALLVAALAGLVSFASPRVLPLAHGYLFYVTGLTGVAINRILGGFVVVMGLAFLGVMRASQREWRFHRIPTFGVAGAPHVAPSCQSPTASV